MGNTFHSVNIHVVFACKDRRPLLSTAMQSRLYKYVHGILQNKGCTLIEGGGVADHVHLLIGMTMTVAISDLMRELKSNTSKWIHETWPGEEFGWQDGYGAFSVSISMIEQTRDYIRRQQEHHKRSTFAQELKKFAEMHGMHMAEDGSVVMTRCNSGQDTVAPDGALGSTEAGSGG